VRDPGERIVGRGLWLKFDTKDEAVTYGEPLGYLPPEWDGPGWYGVYGSYDCQGCYESQLVPVRILRLIYDRQANKLTDMIAEIEALSSV
jgi:hypothetical protein